MKTQRFLLSSSSRAVALVAGALLAAGAAQAQSADSLVVRLSATRISPEVSSGDLTAPAFPGTKADVNSDTKPTAGITWYWTDHISFDLPLAYGFKHDITGDGAIAGVGKIADTKALPITFLAQYRLLDAQSMFRPYVGIGPTYAKFYETRTTAALSALTGGTPANPTTMSIKSKLTVSLQAGVGVNLTPQWSLDMAVL